MASDERLRALQALAAWLEQEAGASAAWEEVELADCGAAGFGFRARAPIAAGRVLCTVPLRLGFSSATARASPTLGPLLRQCSGLREDDEVALLLLHERGAGAASPRAAHVAALPAAYDATVFWSDAELEELRGSPLLAQTLALRALTAADWAELHAALVAPFPQLFPPARCSLEDYRWALATLWSRAMDLPCGDATLRCVVPWADMHNNDGTLPVCHALERTSHALLVLAGRDYAAGDAVGINYGLANGAAALRLHGFLPAGAAVEVPLFAEMSEQADMHDAKRRLLDAAGARAGVPFTLTAAAPLPEALLRALRIQRATAAELAAAERGDAAAVLSEANERTVLTALQGGVEAMLAEYTTTALADEALLQAGAALPARTRDAVTLRLAEKRILAAAAAELQRRLRVLNGTDAADAALAASERRVPEGAPPPSSVEEVAGAAMANAKAPEAAAVLAAYFETVLAEEAAAGGEGEGVPGSAGELDALD